MACTPGFQYDMQVLSADSNSTSWLKLTRFSSAPTCANHCCCGDLKSPTNLSPISGRLSSAWVNFTSRSCRSNGPSPTASFISFVLNRLISSVTENSSSRDHNLMNLHPPKHHHRVKPTKRERVRHRKIHPTLPRFVRAIVEVAGGVFLVVVDGRGDDAFL